MQKLLTIVGALVALLLLGGGCAPTGVAREFAAKPGEFSYVVPLVSRSLVGSATYLDDQTFVTVGHMVRPGESPFVVPSYQGAHATHEVGIEGTQLVRLEVPDMKPLSAPPRDLAYLPRTGELVTLVGINYDRAGRPVARRVVHTRVVPRPEDLPAEYRSLRGFCVAAEGIDGRAMSGGAAVTENGSLQIGYIAGGNGVVAFVAQE